MERRHTLRVYEQELNHLRERILTMAGRVEQMIADATRAFLERDAELAAATIRNDRFVNLDEVEIDQLCLAVLARRQPVASDLRFVTLVLKMVTDLERIADLAVNICERTIDLNQAPPIGHFPAIARMAELTRVMVMGAIDAFVDWDSEVARRVIEQDDEVDDLYHETFRQVLGLMLADTEVVQRGIHVQSVAKFLERMADHSTNLAEQVVLMVEGLDLRHPGKLAQG